MEARYTTILSVVELRTHLADPELAVFDCRFTLSDPARGREWYQQNHIPGAAYVDLDQDLSGRILPGRTGRHPLPHVEQMSQRLSEWGVADDVQVVTYDDAGGAIAARLWWILQWLGHERVAVLDGGWRAWQRAGNPVRQGIETRPPAVFEPTVNAEMVADADLVNRFRADATARVVDARSAERFRGENESLDSVAGHIPGAVSLPFAENLGSDGLFRSSAELAGLYRQRLGDVPAKRIACYCGSGVTAAHSVLAMTYAGLGQPRLYPGSWSEWITDPRRPVSTA